MNKTKKINLRSFRELLLVGVVIVLCMIWTIMNSQFLSANNLSNILRQASYTAIAAVGMTMNKMRHKNTASTPASAEKAVVAAPDMGFSSSSSKAPDISADSIIQR